MWPIGTDTSRPLSWSVQLSRVDEDVKSAMLALSAGFTLKPNDRFSLDFDSNAPRTRRLAAVAGRHELRHLSG